MEASGYLPIKRCQGAFLIPFLVQECVHLGSHSLTEIQNDLRDSDDSRDKNWPMSMGNMPLNRFSVITRTHLDCALEEFTCFCKGKQQVNRELLDEKISYHIYK